MIVIYLDFNILESGDDSYLQFYPMLINFYPERVCFDGSWDRQSTYYVTEQPSHCSIEAVCGGIQLREASVILEAPSS